MTRNFVQSSNLVSVGYDAETSTLEIEFRGNKVYQYPSTDKETYDGLMKAESPGEFFNLHIKSKPSVKI